MSPFAVAVATAHRRRLHKVRRFPSPGLEPLLPNGYGVLGQGRHPRYESYFYAVRIAARLLGIAVAILAGAKGEK